MKQENRMLLITEAKKSLKEITAASLAIPPDHSLIFTEVLATNMPAYAPLSIPVLRPHINFGTQKQKRKDIIRTIEDEEQLYWMTS